MKFKKQVASKPKSSNTNSKPVNKNSFKNKTSKQNKLKKQLLLHSEAIIKDRTKSLLGKGLNKQDGNYNLDKIPKNYVSLKAESDVSYGTFDNENKKKRGKGDNVSRKPRNYVSIKTECDVSDLEDNSDEHLKENDLSVSENILIKKRKPIKLQNDKEEKAAKCVRFDTELEVSEGIDKENKRKNFVEPNLIFSVNERPKSGRIVEKIKSSEIIKKKHLKVQSGKFENKKKSKQKTKDEINSKEELDMFSGEVSKPDSIKKFPKNFVESNLISSIEECSTDDQIVQELHSRQIVKKKSLKMKSKKSNDTKKGDVSKSGAKTKLRPFRNVVYSTPEDIEDATITKGVDVLLNLNEITSSKNSLFNEETVIFLQIICVKIPECPDRVVRFKLPHSLVTATSEVCMIVSDKKKGKRFDHEPQIEYWKDLLEEKGITEVKTVLPMRQLKTEFDQFELKRRLRTMHDFFLVDAKIAGHVSHILGRIFKDKNLIPTPIKIGKDELDDLKNSIKAGLHKTALRLHSAVSTASLRVGHIGMKRQHICENIRAVIDQLDSLYPGGSMNIRSMHIKTPLSLAIPLYITLKPASSLKAPVIKPIRPKMYEAVEDELSTYPRARVQVFPDGNVKLIKTEEDMDDESE